MFAGDRRGSSDALGKIRMMSSVDVGDSGRGLCLEDWGLMSVPVAKMEVVNCVFERLGLEGLGFRCLGVSLDWLGSSEKPILRVL